MSLKSIGLDDIPWFAIVGAAILASFFMYKITVTDFSSYILPIYLTEALMFIGFGYAILRKHENAGGFTIFLMAMMWLMNQILTWSGAGSSINLWILCGLEILFSASFFLNKPLLKYFSTKGKEWTYAGYWLIFIFAVAKVWINYTLALPFGFWGIAVLLVSFGYILQPVKKEYGGIMALIGTLLALFVALALGSQYGLTLVP